MVRLSGLRNICSTDASATVVERMRERAARADGCGCITWAVADMLALPFDDGAFDVVVEKGTIDCFMARARRCCCAALLLLRCRAAAAGHVLARCLAAAARR
jgi:hypothetical protein